MCVCVRVCVCEREKERERERERRGGTDRKRGGRQRDILVLNSEEKQTKNNNIVSFIRSFRLELVSDGEEYDMILYDHYHSCTRTSHCLPRFSSCTDIFFPAGISLVMLVLLRFFVGVMVWTVVFLSLIHI